MSNLISYGGYVLAVIIFVVQEIQRRKAGPNFKRLRKEIVLMLASL
jgi:hypothetical protein